jgi:hypothetical protein
MKDKEPKTFTADNSPYNHAHVEEKEPENNMNPITIEVGWLQNSYGEISNTPEGKLKLKGDVEALENIVKNMRPEYSTNEDFLNDLPKRLRSYCWANKV